MPNNATYIQTMSISLAINQLNTDIYTLILENTAMKLKMNSTRLSGRLHRRHTELSVNTNRSC